MNTVRENFDSWGLQINYAAIKRAKKTPGSKTLQEFLDSDGKERLDTRSTSMSVAQIFVHLQAANEVILWAERAPEQCAYDKRNSWDENWDKYFLPHSSGLTLSEVFERRVTELYRADLPYYVILLEERASASYGPLAPRQEGQEEMMYVTASSSHAGGTFPSLMLAAIYGKAGGDIVLIPRRFLKQGPGNRMGEGSQTLRRYWLSVFKDDEELMERTWFYGDSPLGEVTPVSPQDNEVTRETMAVLSETLSLPEAAAAARLV